MSTIRNSRLFTRRALLIGAAATAPVGLLASRWVAAAEAAGALTPEMFGAKGDGVTNDSAALARLAAAVNAAGGGLISFAAGKTYIVGSQSLSDNPRSRFAFEPHDLLHLRGCTKPLTIRGNGARLKSAPGLRYGTFDRSGRRTDNPMPFTGRGEAASPYRHMIRIEQCSGPIEISDLELDGNLASLTIGGRYGDKGRQLPGSGLGLIDNSGSETVRNIYTHHHPLDGLYIDGVTEPVRGITRQITGVRSEYNGRQGCSIVGGGGYEFSDCKFNHTGKAGLFSPPGAGVDIEAEGRKTNRDFRFVNCEFVNNTAMGMAAASGDSEGAVFEGCLFVGTTGAAVLPRKPRFRFHDCTIVGRVSQAFPDPDPARAAQFHSTYFTDDPRRSPTGEVHVLRKVKSIAHLAGGDRNVLFSKCRFDLVDELLLPATRQAIYADCRMSQASPQLAHPRGTYLGTSSIVGNVNLKGSRVLGTVLVNGVPFQGR